MPKATKPAREVTIQLSLSFKIPVYLPKRQTAALNGDGWKKVSEIRALIERVLSDDFAADILFEHTQRRLFEQVSDIFKDGDWKSVRPVVKRMLNALEKDGRFANLQLISELSQMT